jgi:hypothetical protein
LIPLKFEKCGHVLNQTVWDECEEATERGKRGKGDMAFNVNNKLPACLAVPKKRDGIVIASLRERNNPRYK